MKIIGFKKKSKTRTLRVKISSDSSDQNAFINSHDLFAFKTFLLGEKKINFYLRVHPFDPYFIFCIPQNSGLHLSQRVPPTPGKQVQLPVAASQLLNPKQIVQVR